MGNTFRMAVVVALGVATSAAVALAASRAESTGDVVSRLQEAASRKSSKVELCTQPGEGRYGIVSLQDAYSDKELQTATEQFRSQLRFPILFARADGSAGMSNARRMMLEQRLDVAFFVVDDKSMPMSLVCLEERWGIVNAAKLLEGSPDAKTRALRLRRELARVTKALLCSGSTNKGTSAVSSAKDLEALPADPIDANSLMAMVNSLQSFGLRAPRTVPYRRACQEGWAPAPTNDVQRAIWERVKAERGERPSNPIKVTFDPGTAPRVGK